MSVDEFKKRVKQITKQEGTFSALVFGCFARGFDNNLFPYPFSFPPLIWGFKKEHGYVIFDETAYVYTAEESYKHFSKGTFQKEEEEAAVTEAIMRERLPTTIHPSYLRHLATLYGQLFGATIYAEAINESFAKRHDEEDEHFFTMATLPVFETFTMRQLKSALNGDVKSLRQQHSGYYLAAEATGMQEATLAEYEEPERALKEMERARRENAAQQAAYRKTLPAKKQILFDYLALGTHVRDRRKDALGALCILLTDAARHLLASHDIDPALAPFCHYADFDQDLPDNYGTTLRERERGFAFLTFHDPPRRETISYEEGLMVLEMQEEVKGRCANPGQAEGPARIVMSKEDFPKFRDGDILVTSMTRPEFVPLMKRAAAIITDEGGLTCHAAIISRELGKPCIISTGNATRTLHDDEFLVVDGTTGTIKRQGSSSKLTSSRPDSRGR